MALRRFAKEHAVKLFRGVAFSIGSPVQFGARSVKRLPAAGAGDTGALASRGWPRSRAAVPGPMRGLLGSTAADLSAHSFGVFVCS